MRERATTISRTRPGESPAADVFATWSAPGDRFRAAAEVMAGKLGLPCREATSEDVRRRRLMLVVGSSGLELREAGSRGRGLCIDFIGKKKGSHPPRHVSVGQPLGKALGPRRDSVVIDATAGLARDTFLIASLGYVVIAVERSPILAAMMRDGLARGLTSRSAKLRKTVGNILFLEHDSCEELSKVGTHGAPDVVYLDPMYAPKKKSALARKEMRILRRLVGDDPDAPALFSAARRVATRRVVVKRHRHALPLHPKPDLQFKGRTTRYDVYLAQP